MTRLPATCAAERGRMHPTLLDPALQARFEEHGYAVIDLLDRQAVNSLRSRFFDLYRGESEGCHHSTESSDAEYRAALHGLVTGVLFAAVQGVMTAHRVLMTGALVKWGGPDSAVRAHQDWTAVDEDRYRSVNLWVPLCDVDEDNGAIAVLPGSHRVLSAMRVNTDQPFPAPDPWDGIDVALLTSVPMRAGQCLVIDNALLHASPPNETADPRVALIMGVVPADATMRHYWRRADGLVDHYTVHDEGFYVRCTPGVEPSGPDVELTETIELTPHRSDARAWILGHAATPPPDARDAAETGPVGPAPDPGRSEPVTDGGTKIRRILAQGLAGVAARVRR